MTFLEKDLEQIIFETDNRKLITRGLYLNGTKKRQLRLGNYGIADIVSFHVDNDDIYDVMSDQYKREPYLEITVCELKQNKLDVGTFLQAIRYCKGIESYIKNSRRKQIELKFSVVLIGKEVSSGDFVYFPDFISNLKIYTYSYEFEGILFKEIKTYQLSTPGF